MRHKEFDPAVALDQAMVLFWDTGYEATSVQDLTEKLGIGRRSLYDTFGDKHSLFMQSLRHYAETEARRVWEAVERAADAREGVRVLLGAGLSQSSRGTGCLVVNTATEVGPRDGDAAEFVEQHLGGVRSALTDLVRRGQGEGSIANPAAPEVLASVLFTAWLGLRVGVRAGLSRRRLERDLSDILSLLDRA
ncbi:TetR/AcrR family transcriptional regulator [Kutzneria kofuensis]|uniref:TetR/AcrR family transcriptional repressor of nem operon n=1 Tax=Kutzneria kofuensis TaxID=103725 RepID=A0A7W9KR17_9PSEU|nr:TetR/AcrR family transcriptional regulator [Kutzneria kofuensis]MBB5896434.1 TetR/AcrR family transcriptional repressor of nem operon [Kutzneria kofuensis]